MERLIIAPLVVISRSAMPDRTEEISASPYLDKEERDLLHEAIMSDRRPFSLQSQIILVHREKPDSRHAQLALKWTTVWNSGDVYAPVIGKRQQVREGPKLRDEVNPFNL